MTKLTVKDLFDKKGKVKLTELYVTNALEAYAACLLYTSPSPRDCQ